MLIRRPDDLPSSAITPESVALNRRHFVGAAGALALGSVLTNAATPATLRALGGETQDLKLTAEDVATGYNNYYEFGTDKDEPKELAKDFKPKPWTVAVEGLVKSPKTFDFDSLIKGLPLQDRVYRHRCVEAWSMVIPWQGVQLKDIVARCEPTASAKFVEFTTLMDPARMPGQRRAILPWPYVEALRLDEAMNPLALLVTGMYGKSLPNQNGAPLKLVVPWKYGFKGGKAIVKIRFTDTMPRTTWNDVAPSEYGFYGNVNPLVDHPRWSQAKERPVGQILRINTLMFNGYSDQVASMYKGMDLRKWF